MSSKAPQNNSETVPFPFVLVLFGGALAIVVWILFHQELSKIFFTINKVLFYPFYLMFGRFLDHSNELWNLFNTSGGIPKRNTWQANLKFSWFFSNEVGKYLRWPYMLILGAIAWKLFYDPLKKFKGPMTVENFLKYQSEIWKPIVPFLKRDLCNDTSPDFLPSLGPVEFAQKHGVLIRARFMEAEARAALKKDIAGKFDKNKLDPTEKTLFVVFGLRIMRRPADSKKILDHINESLRNKNVPDFSYAHTFFEAVSSDKIVAEKIKSHLYTSTVLCEMLNKATEFDGVLPPSEFIAWVKPTHRSLFYALNRVPAEAKKLEVASFSEGLGIICQWQAERVAKISGGRLKGIFLDRAILAWKDYLYKSGAIAEEVSNINAAALAVKNKERLEKEEKDRRRSAITKAGSTGTSL